jgi:hypothetical protein
MARDSSKRSKLRQAAKPSPHFGPAAPPPNSSKPLGQDAPDHLLENLPRYVDGPGLRLPYPPDRMSPSDREALRAIMARRPPRPPAPLWFRVRRWLLLKIRARKVRRFLREHPGFVGGAPFPIPPERPGEYPRWDE